MNQLIWVNQLDQLTEAVISNFGLLRHEDLYFKPDANRWSIAENLAHLIVVNRTYFPVIEQIRNNTYKVPFIGKIPFLPKLFGSVLIEYVKPEKEEAKVKTFPIWEPANFKEEGSILELFEKHQQSLRNLGLKTRISFSVNKLLLPRLIITSCTHLMTLLMLFFCTNNDISYKVKPF